MRQNTLNRVGVYNRCKLTCLVVDTKWDKKVFNGNWSVKAAKEKTNFLAEEGIGYHRAGSRGTGGKGSKRRKSIHFTRRERTKLPVELSEVVAMEPAKELFL